MKFAAIIAGAVVGAVLLVLLFMVWWRRFVIRRIAAWTASAIMGLVLDPSPDLERRIRWNIARVLRVPIHLVKILREKGGVRIRVLLCGNATTLVPRRTAMLFARHVRPHLPPWHEFGIEAAPEDPGLPPEPSSPPARSTW